MINTDIERIRILDVPVDLVDNAKTMEVFCQLMDRPGCDLLITPNPEIIIRASEDAEIMEILESGALNIPDGIGIVYASKILGHPLSERVTGVDVLARILACLNDNGRPVFFLGSSPAADGHPSVADMAAEQMKKVHPGLNIVGTHDGYYKPEEEAALVEEINASGAEFLCVAMGAPRQEKFMYNHRSEFTNVKVAMGVGGSLDVWAGTVKRAPEFFINHNIEWLYRLVKQPSRFKRQLALPKFMIRVMASKKS